MKTWKVWRAPGQPHHPWTTMLHGIVTERAAVEAASELTERSFMTHIAIPVPEGMYPTARDVVVPKGTMEAKVVRRGAEVETIPAYGIEIIDILEKGV